MCVMASGVKIPHCRTHWPFFSKHIYLNEFLHNASASMPLESSFFTVHLILLELQYISSDNKNKLYFQHSKIKGLKAIYSKELNFSQRWTFDRENNTDQQCCHSPRSVILYLNAATVC